jgi:hypothetical protein
MKKQLLILAFFILSIHCFPQIVFENGYFINENNEKTECLIKHVEWKNNPDGFQYKLTESSDIQKASIHNIQEFGITNSHKYLRAVVEIDRSKEHISDLSPIKNPVFQEEMLFLKVLVEGKAALFHFEDVNLKRFFYSTDGSGIKQLVYKPYAAGNSQIGYNFQFRQQLHTALKCPSISLSDFETLKYNQKDLVRIFVRYNACMNSKFINFDERQRKDFFQLTFRPGMNYSSLSMYNSIYDAGDTDFDPELSFRFGLEAEFTLPFNKNKWAIIIEPTYQYFRSIKLSQNRNIEVNYQSIELPLGIRHYFYLNENSKIFANASYMLDIAFNSTIKRSTGYVFEIATLTNYGFGLGYKYKNRYSLEVRYFSSRNLLFNYAAWDSKYKTMAVILGYSIF